MSAKGGDQVIVHDPIHTLVYGDSGAGKTTFARTFPKPIWVACFDPFDKSRPFLKLGTTTHGHDATGTPFAEVVGQNGELLVRIEYYIDLDLQQPQAYARYLKRMATFHHEYSKWASGVFDSVTFAELSARKWSQYVLNRGAKEPRQWFAASTDMIEETLLSRWTNMPLNTVVIAHVDEDKDEVHGTFIRSPKMPGQRLRKGSAAGFGEFYHAFVTKDADNGNRVHLLQTRSDHLWNAASQIDAPNPCPPHYLALWAGDAEDDA
jgi:AAA domain